MIVTQAPQDSALVRSMIGEDHTWGLAEQLLAAAVDALNIANWQRGEGKRKDRPRPLPRPGVKRDKTYGTGAIPMDQMADWLGWERQLAQPIDRQGR